MSQPTTRSLNFRLATQDDVATIIELVHAAYRGESSRAGWTTEADFLDGTRTDTDEISEIISTPGNAIVLCDNNKQLLASVHIQKQNETTCYLGMFAVRPTEQGHGIGKKILTTAENMAQQLWQCKCMQMSVITLRTELIAWYERRGYQRTGSFKPFPYGIARYGKPKRNDLLLEILEKNLQGGCNPPI